MTADGGAQRRLARRAAVACRRGATSTRIARRLGRACPPATRFAGRIRSGPRGEAACSARGGGPPSRWDGSGRCRSRSDPRVTGPWSVVNGARGAKSPAAPKGTGVLMSCPATSRARRGHRSPPTRCGRERDRACTSGAKHRGRAPRPRPGRSPSASPTFRARTGASVGPAARRLRRRARRDRGPCISSTTGDARPTFPGSSARTRPASGDRPTLVQNVESLAYRRGSSPRHGDAWYRSAGRGQTRGTALVDGGAAPSRSPGVHENRVTARPLGEVATLAGITGRRDAHCRPGRRLLRWAGRRSRRSWSGPSIRPTGRPESESGFRVAVSYRSQGPETCGVRGDRGDHDVHGWPERPRNAAPCVFRPRRDRGRDPTARRRWRRRPDDCGRIDRWARPGRGDRGVATIPTGAAGLFAQAPSASSADEFARTPGRGARCSRGARRRWA